MPNQGDKFTGEIKDRGPKFRDRLDRLMLVWQDSKGVPYEESYRATTQAFQRFYSAGANVDEFHRAHEAAKAFNLS